MKSKETLSLSTLLATVGIGLGIASLLVPWFAFRRDKAILLIEEPALGFAASGDVEKRPWWGALPPEGGTCYHLRAARTVVYDSRLSDVEVAMVHWGGRVASVLMFVNVLAWLGVFGGGIGHYNLRPWVLLLLVFSCVLVALFVPCSVIFSVVGNACLGERKGALSIVPERVILQEVSLLRVGPLLLASGTMLEVAAVVLVIWARRRLAGVRRDK
jgi:hypothetical protein